MENVKIENKISRISLIILLTDILLQYLLNFISFIFKLDLSLSICPSFIMSLFTMIIDYLLAYLFFHKGLSFNYEINFMTFIIYYEILLSISFFVLIIKNKCYKLYFKNIINSFKHNRKILIYAFLIVVFDLTYSMLLANYSKALCSKMLKKNYLDSLYSIKYSFSKIVFISLESGILEEIIFKGILFNLFYTRKKWINIIKMSIISIIFASFHITYYMAFFYKELWVSYNFNILLTGLLSVISYFSFQFLTLLLYKKYRDLNILFFIHFMINFILFLVSGGSTILFYKAY